jgi:hypothetical protein
VILPGTIDDLNLVNAQHATPGEQRKQGNIPRGKFRLPHNRSPHNVKLEIRLATNFRQTEPKLVLARITEEGFPEARLPGVNTFLLFSPLCFRPSGIGAFRVCPRFAWVNNAVNMGSWYTGLFVGKSEVVDNPGFSTRILGLFLHY